MKRAVAVSLVTSLLVVGSVAAPAAACACGAPAPLPGSEVNVDRETAIVRWDGELEEIVMQLGMFADAGETGLVVPTPSPATVTAGDAATFDALEAAILPVTVIEWDWWGNQRDGIGGGGAPPTVLDRVQLGPIEATTLAASDTAGLTEWLAVNGYELSPAVQEQLGPYVDEGWSFVALRLTSAAPFEGALDPIRFTFESEQLVYPMRMSAAADTPQTVRLYVLGEHRAMVSATSGDLDGGQTIAWAGPVDGELAELGAYLTVVDLFFPDPATQITSDLAIADAPTDDPVIPTILVDRVATMFDIPLGWVIVLAIVLLLIMIAAFLGARTRGRRELARH